MKFYEIPPSHPVAGTGARPGIKNKPTGIKNKPPGIKNKPSGIKKKISKLQKNQPGEEGQGQGHSRDSEP